MDPTERESVEKQLESHRDNLRLLLEKRAGYVEPSQIPLELESSIRHHQREIERIEGLLAGIEQQAIVEEQIGDGQPTRVVGGEKLSSDTEQHSSQNCDVFVVHGHDEAAKESVARFIEKLGLRAIILHEQPNAGRTIIEKFEDYSNVGFVVVLLTPDDIAVSRSRPGEEKLRARQNVIFELGYFIGKLGRSKVCALYKEGVEIPSDYQGLVYITMDPYSGWRLSLAKEIRQAGMDIDLEEAL